MSDEPPEPVTADAPDAPFHTTGTDHVTIWGSNEADTLAFYRDLLGMPLVLRQPNLDDPSQTHLFFDTGDGRILTVFVSDERPSARGQRPGTGAVHHLCFSVDPAEYESIMNALTDAGKGYNVFDRGIFHSIYTRDNNGLVIELSSDKYAIPDEKKGAVFAAAHQFRIEDDAEFTQDRHMEAALESLGLPVEKYDLPDADAGVGM